MAASFLRAHRVAVGWSLLTLVSLLLALSWYLEEPSWPKTAIVSNHQAEAAPELGPAASCLDDVVTVRPGGRLGNLILEYASAAVVARRHHRRLAVPSAIYDSLSTVFGNLTAEPLSVVLQEPPCRGRNLSEEDVLDEQWIIEEATRCVPTRRLPIVLSRYVVLTDYIASSLEFIRDELRFLAELQSASNKKLEKIISEIAHKTGFNKTQVCTVGVHVRRTDYVAYMRDTYQLRLGAGVAYYELAAAAMLADLRAECSAVAFAVTSDDAQWCQRHLMPSLDRNAREGSPPSVGFLLASGSSAADLCLLSSCQHLIMTYGTYGLTAAILSGGRTIMYDTAAHGAAPIPPAQKMTSLVPHWRMLM